MTRSLTIHGPVSSFEMLIETASPHAKESICQKNSFIA
jgi:hypothetical protein